MLSLLAASTFLFTGGTSSDLAKALGTSSGRAVAVGHRVEQRFAAARFDWDGLADLSHEARRAFSFGPGSNGGAKRGVLGFGGAWPDYLVSPAMRIVSGSSHPEYSNGHGGGGNVYEMVPRPLVRKGKLTRTEEGLTTGGEAVVAPASELAQGPLHPYLGEVPVAMFAERASVEEVREAVLEALGADEKGEPHWTEFRARYLGGLAEVARQARAEPGDAGKLRALSAEVKSIAFAGLRDEMLKGMFDPKRRGMLVVLDGPVGSPLQRAAWSYLNALPKPDPNAKPPTGAARWSQVGVPFSFAFSDSMPVLVSFRAPADFLLSVNDRSQAVNVVLQ